MNTQVSKTKKFILLLSLTSFIMSTYGFGRNIFPMITPDIVGDLNLTYATIGVITAFHQVGYLTFSYVSGRLSPLLGAAQLSLGAVIISGICLLLLGILSETWAVGVLITILGICAAASWIPMVSIVSQFLSEKNLGKALGLISSGTSYGVFTSGFAVPYFLNRYGWESVWLISGAATVLLGLLGMIYLRSLGAFRLKQSYKKEPEKKVLFSNKARIMHISLLMFLTGIALIPFQTYLIPYLREDLHLTIEVGGMVWKIIGLLGMVSGFIVGSLADKISIRRTLIISYLLIFVSSVLLLVYPIRAIVFCSAVLFGLAYYGFFGLIPAYISKTISKEHSSSILGVSFFALGVGSALGNYLGGLSKTLTASFITTYFSISLICIVLIYLSILLKEDTRTSWQH